MTKEQKVHEAAQAVIDHGGPACLTDPYISLRLMGEAYDLGATADDIKTEMRHIRKEQP